MDLTVTTSYNEFRDYFEAIKDPRDAALIATIYCGYARVGEIVRGKYDKSKSILRQHIVFTPNHLELSIKTEKTFQWRKAVSSRALEDWLHEPIRNWLNITRDEEVFPFCTWTAEKVFKKWFGTYHIHLLRHWACTHCLQGKRTKVRLEMHDIQKLGGWTDITTPTKVYSHFIIEDIKELI